MNKQRMLSAMMNMRILDMKITMIVSIWKNHQKTQNLLNGNKK